MKLYHFSEKQYQIGDIVDLHGMNSISYDEATDKQKRTIDCFDEYIVKHYPQFVLRRNAVFAFDDVKYAHMYGVQTHKKGKVYEIETEFSYKGPFALVNGLFSILDKTDKDKEDCILQEYFSPKAIWKVFEYLSERFVVTNMISGHIPYTYDFQEDHDLFDSLFVNNNVVY